MPGSDKPRPVRVDALKDYLFSLKKRQGFMDFALSRALLRSNNEVYAEEEDFAMDEMWDDAIIPYTLDENGNQTVLDMKQAKLFYRDFAMMWCRFQEQLGKEYKKAYDSLPEDHPNREQAAGFIAKQSEAYLIINMAQIVGSNLMNQSRKQDGFNGYDVWVEASDNAYGNMKSRMNEEERRLYEIGRDLSQMDSQLLEGYKPEDCGLETDKLKEMQKKSEAVLNVRLDRNWFKDETMKDDPWFLDPQVSSDHNMRMNSNYFTLETSKEKLDFYERGAFAFEAAPALFSDSEKLGFGKVISGDFFFPVYRNGIPDPGRFEKRVNALADRIALYKVEEGRFIDNEDLSKYTDKTDAGSRQYAAGKLCSAAMRGKAIQDHFIRDIEEGNIDRELMTSYCVSKGMLLEGLQGDALLTAFKDAFNERIRETACADLDNERLYELTQNPVGDKLSEEEKNRIDLEGEKVKANITSDFHNQKVWLRPENNVSLEAMKKLDNLFDQFDKEDSIFHYNSGRYEKLRAALKEAHDKYSELSAKGRKMTEKDKVECVRIFDKINKASTRYLEDKKVKERGSKLGQSRYEICFAALNITNHGSAVAIMQPHNQYRYLAGAKEISLADLEKRAGRNYKAQKQHEKEAKKSGKKRIKAAPSLADPISMDGINDIGLQ